MDKGKGFNKCFIFNKNRPTECVSFKIISEISKLIRF